MLRRLFYSCAVVVVQLLFSSQIHAEVKLPNVFGNGMVLQSSVKIPVWGWANPGERVLVEFRSESRETQADGDGYWRVDLPPQESGGPYELKIVAEKIVLLSDVYVGEVWVCAGQSNMSFQLKRVTNSQQEISSANYPKVRFITVPAQSSEQPLDNFNTQWEVCSPQTVPELSALAFYFGRNLSETLETPVGLIVLAWGGSTAEAWTDKNKLVKYPELAPLLDSKRIEKTIECQKPGRLYNGMLCPVCPFAIKGVIWYQGESNANRAWQYRTLFPIMIANWRDSWGQGDFPFYYVQLPNFMKSRDVPGDSAWAELREAQHRTLSIRNVGEVVSIDSGASNELHPQNKEIIGGRLANLALAQTYDRDVPYSGPVFKTMSIVDDKVVLTFNHTENGLVSLTTTQCDNSTLRGFAIAGKDHKFYWADAEIQGDKVVVSSPKVDSPVAVRYAWADNPICNLGNSVGLPASPFRTDDWAGATVNSR